MTAARLVSVSSVVLLCAAIAAGVLVREVGEWDAVVFVLLCALVLGADLLPIEAGPVQISGSFLGLVVAMALLGPLAAAVIGVASSATDALRARPRVPIALCNLAAFALFPLVGGLVMHGLAGLGGLRTADPEWILVMLPGFAAATAVNYLVVFGGLRLVDGGSLAERLQRVFVPLIPSELAMLLLAAIIVYGHAHVGPVALGSLAGLVVLYLWLLRELLVSRARARELDERTRKLASLQVGVLTAMLKTLALRDHMTARHSAAVARYARVIAREAGYSEAEQELVHTAGLLHDIGKFIFPDRILQADRRLSDEDWEIVKRHPYQGAKVVRQVEGYGPVADIILCHHERIDGTGYPRGLAGEEIPRLARMISVADTYDVMTARDSYRKPVKHTEAVAELRRVAGRQLDAELVEAFVAALARERLAFRHADDADFEAELAFERRVHEYARPRPRLAA